MASSSLYKIYVGLIPNILEAENLQLVCKKILAEEDGLLEARRNLVLQTKEFKQLPLEEQQNNHQNLLKLYQKEIDSLVMKLKEHYSAFQQTLPMFTIFSSMAQIEEENVQLKQQVVDMETIQQENTELALGLEAANAMISRQSKQLEDFRQTNNENSKIQTEYGQNLRELTDLKRVLAERESNILALDEIVKEKSMENEVLSLKLEEVMREKNEAMQAKEESEKLKKDELEIIIMNFNNTRQQLISLQRDNELIKMELQSKKEGNSETQTLMLEKECSKLQEQVCEMKKENKKLLSEKASILLELEKARSAAGSDGRTDTISTVKIKKLEGEITGLKSKIQELNNDAISVKSGIKEKDEKIKELQETIRQYEESTTINSMPLVSQALSPSQDGAVVTVLTHQRDRFKKQSHELEKKLNEIEKRLEKEVSLSSRLRGENAELAIQLSSLNNNIRRNGQDYDSEKGCDTLNCDIGLNPMLQKIKVFMQTGDTNILRHLGHVLSTQKFTRRLLLVYFVILHFILIYTFFRKH